ncbi:MAG TPA: TRAP transporter small permease subunit [Candidatus Limnocylindria bacterium]|nr:TRAP transporter small permease subunit [Candidatus Limnocylindria bacterium]
MAPDERRLDDPADVSVESVFESEPPTETELFEENLHPEILPGREPWRSIVHGIGIVEQAVGAFFILVILILVVSLVAQRYLPGVSLPWTGEVARLSMVWATFVMSGYLASRDRHIAIHLVDYVLKGRALTAIKLAANVIVFVTCVGLVYATIQLLADDVGQVTPAAEIPLLIVNSVPIVGFSLTALRAALAVAVIDLPALRRPSERAA